MNRTKTSAISVAKYNLDTLHRAVDRSNDAKRELERVRLDLCSDSKYEVEAAEKRLASAERVYAVSQTEVKVAKATYAKSVQEIKDFLAAEEEAKKPLQLTLDLDLASASVKK